MSGHTDSVLQRQQIATSSEQFLPKPFAASVLADSVRQVLDGKMIGGAA
jgi:hypothetical protein